MIDLAPATWSASAVCRTISNWDTMSGRVGESRSATTVLTFASAVRTSARVWSRTMAVTSYLLRARMSWRAWPPMKPVAPAIVIV